MKHFESFMAPQLQQYAAYRQVLGYAKKCIKPPLLAFDRYLIEQNASWDQLQPAFFLQLRATISDHPNTVNKILSALRSFFQFLVRNDICVDNPLKDSRRCLSATLSILSSHRRKPNGCCKPLAKTSEKHQNTF